MPELIQKTDYDENLELQPQEFINSTNLTGIIQAIHSSANYIEQALFEIRDWFWLETAEGVQLDTIGLILGEDRKGRTDEDYRAAIKVAGSSKFNGTPEDIISAIRSLYGATSVVYDPGYPGNSATYFIRADAVGLTENILNSLSPAGVRGQTGINFVTGAGDNIIIGTGDNMIVT